MNHAYAYVRGNVFYRIMSFAPLYYVFTTTYWQEISEEKKVYILSINCSDMLSNDVKQKIRRLSRTIFETNEVEILV